MDLPTYTNIWRIEKRLYKLYDFRLPAPLPITWIGVFTAITVPYVVFLIAIGLPFNHTLVWLYILPPGALTWLTTRPVIESKRLPELVSSQLRYIAEPRAWCRMAPFAEKDEILVTARVSHEWASGTGRRWIANAPGCRWSASAGVPCCAALGTQGSRRTMQDVLRADSVARGHCRAVRMPRDDLLPARPAGSSMPDDRGGRHVDAVFISLDRATAKQVCPRQSPLGARSLGRQAGRDQSCTTLHGLEL